jgi:Rha family phage regulatory protein
MNTNSIAATESTVTTMTSREIAELTGKRHDHVLRDIRNMVEQLSADPNLGWHCKSITYEDAQGKPRDMYVLDKNTTIVLISGYDVVLRMRIVNRWQELESQQSQFRIPKTLSEALQLAADQAKQIEYQNEQIEVMTPKAEYYDQLLGSDELCDGEMAAKTLRTSRNKLYSFLKQRGVITKSNLPMQLYIDKDYMRIKNTPYNDVFGNPKMSCKIMFTQKGIQYIRMMFNELMVNVEHQVAA